MAKSDDGGREPSAREMILAVLADAPDAPAAEVKAAVWERYEAAVTLPQISQARRALRPKEPPPKPAKKPPRPKPVRAAARTKPPIKAKTYAGAQVTVEQLSAILEVAEAAGGLRKLQEALRTMLLVRETVGDVDERQLAFALDFLAKLTGRKL